MSTHIRISDRRSNAILSPAQKKFNSLIKKIDKQKKLLALWQESITRCQTKVAGELQPMLQSFHEHQRELVYLIDALHSTQKFGHRQLEKIVHLMCKLCEDLLQAENSDDIKEIYNQYSGLDFDSEQEEVEFQNAAMKGMFERMFSVQVDDDFDFRNPQEAADLLFGKLEEQDRQAEEHRAKQKKSSKQAAKEAAKEARLKQEEVNISKSIRAVYRQLVAALHPDRESDPAEQQRKTELMQKVTVAYAKQDLLQLLELQLEVEQIDQLHIDQMADDRLKYFNKILQNQSDELQDELEALEMQQAAVAGMSPYEKASPARVEFRLQMDISQLRTQLDNIRDDLQRFRDPKAFKRWLNRYQIPEEEFAFDLF